jgi:hypothetical protein
MLLWPAGLVFGLVAEWIGQPELAFFDAAAGFALIFLGLVAWSRRSDSRVGLIMVGAGFAWFLGTLWTAAVFLDRGPLAHLLLSYPRGRVSTRRERVAVGAAYVYAAVYPIAQNTAATIVFAFGLIALSARRYVTARGQERWARLAPLVAAVAFGFVLMLDLMARRSGLGHERAALFAYDLVVCAISIGLFADFVGGRSRQRAVQGLVVDLGGSASVGPLGDRLAQTLGDPTLVVGYWLAEKRRYVDEAGRPLEIPAPHGDRAVTPIAENGRRVAVLIHDAAVLEDRRLLSEVASAARLAVSNARLHAEVRARVAEVETSRRRIVEAADGQRQRLERQLREGPERRLARVVELVADSGPLVAESRVGFEAARNELREFARGLHPATLSDRGLHAAIEELAARSPIPIRIVVPEERFPATLEAAVYFVCSESLANVAKYAAASRAEIAVVHENEQLTVVVTDDGMGGADPSRGSGLRGLADRVEALGGQMSLESVRAEGTRVTARLPCAGAQG